MFSRSRRLSTEALNMIRINKCTLVLVMVMCSCCVTSIKLDELKNDKNLLYQNLFKPDQLGKTGGGGSSVASTRAASRPASGDRDGAPMAKHVVNKSSADGEETSKTRAVPADAQPSALKSTMSEKRADKCKEKCPANIKECCRNAIAEKSCHNATDDPVSYFVNPSYPNEDWDSSFCDFRVDIKNRNVCQLRLDLEEFSLRGPHKYLGSCRQDRLIISTTLPNGIGITELCGNNTGQHLYFPVDPKAGGSSVALMMMTSQSSRYSWKVRITQIDCLADPQAVAPTGCLQYHTSLSGTIQSFNYAGGMYQSGLDYAVCIKRSVNTCRVEFQQVPGSTFGINSMEGPSLEEGIGRAGEVSCDLVTHDYLHIPGGMLDIGEEILAATGNVEVYTPTAEKFCGRSLSGLAIQEFAEKIKVNDPLGAQDNNTIATPVTSYASGPIIVRFHTDSVTVRERDIGFSIAYQQLGTGCNKNKIRR
ncbi:uncharacterized protein LOC100574541 isoform X1 [Acyrthosiphon pisum]|uniref:CUB domain-containing protein n=1 Tax=Acyrthosiphon pisum TaxID=7029 RepID=A0A8R2ABH0_ACYPI|nr:uncharacterized protein LOC100574541 isoform X1 [Acyrthosiphon pisum]|eukprot:XP_003246195.1 PREDICTED: uncharacterized protein LOC100574541 isoform X1 [Acyrthosiphon pisum]